MHGLIRGWPGIARTCAAVLLCSAMAVAAQPAGYSGKRAATVNFKEAERRVQQARLTRERGKQPITAEEVREGVNPRPDGPYQRRQAVLERALAAAEHRYHETTLALQAYDRPRPLSRNNAVASATAETPLSTGQSWPTASPISLTQ